MLIFPLFLRINKCRDFHPNAQTAKGVVNIYFMTSGKGGELAAIFSRFSESGFSVCKRLYSLIAWKGETV